MPVVDPKLIERVKAAKARRRSSSVQYRHQSRIAFVLHSFNRVSNVNQLFARLRRLGNHELIVCEDGSLDGSHEKWMSHLHRPNDFLIHSNDLHEIRILDRAIRFARAEIICLVQDDDRIPRETGWLNSALKRFNTYPNLAIIGGFIGFRSFHPDPERAKPVWGSSRKLLLCSAQTANGSDADLPQRSRARSIASRASAAPGYPPAPPQNFTASRRVVSPQ